MADNPLFIIPEIDPEIPILIAGATGSGKSALALGIAKEQGRAVVNADALQVYGCWRVLSARPTKADEAAARHLLYGHIDCATPYSVGGWLRDMARVLAAETGPAPIIIGGTGLYFSCLTEGLVDIPPIPAALRTRSEEILASDGIARLLADLDARDPETAARVYRLNPKRVQRAWEVLEATGQGLTEWQASGPPPLMPLARCRAFVLDGPRDWLTPRLAARFETMWETGARDEVERNLALMDTTLPAAQAIGAREIAAYLKGELSREEAIEQANIATRQYAKRQRSWFRNRLKSWVFLPLSQ